LSRDEIVVCVSSSVYEFVYLDNNSATRHKTRTKEEEKEKQRSEVKRERESKLSSSYFT